MQTRFKILTLLRNDAPRDAIQCIQCHLRGLNAPTKKKSTQRMNFQSIAYFAYLFMKLTLIYVKVVKYFPF